MSKTPTEITLLDMQVSMSEETRDQVERSLERRVDYMLLGQDIDKN